MAKPIDNSARQSEKRESGKKRGATLVTDSPQREGTSTRNEERPPEDRRGQTSHKAGMKSVAQKMDESKYADRGTPQSQKVPGAHGREPAEPEETED